RFPTFHCCWARLDARLCVVVICIRRVGWTLALIMPALSQDAVPNRHRDCLWRALFWLRLSHRLHRHAQQMARRNDQARRRSLQLADRQMGMGRTAKGVLNVPVPLPAVVGTARSRVGAAVYRYSSETRPSPTGNKVSQFTQPNLLC